MKYVMLIGEGLADDPVPDLGGRTPLEAAKTPFMDLLSKKGRVGSVSFVPHDLPVASDVAVLAALGFDPREFYTGLAPLEAAALGIPVKDGEVVFRLDLVTVLDDVLVDPMAGVISNTEARQIVVALGEALGPNMRVYAGDRYRNFLVVSGADAEAMDELEIAPPDRLVGQKLSKHRPKGPGAPIVAGVLDKAKAALENSEINRVRIDLGENPANAVWLWGQGMAPKTPSFGQKRTLSAAMISEADFARGLGKSLGMTAVESLSGAIEEFDFTFVYMRADGPRKIWDLKNKIKRIEDFDSIVGMASKALDRQKEYRLFVGTDFTESLVKKAPARGAAPYFMAGTGIAAENLLFSEKTAAQSKAAAEETHHFMDLFLKTGS